MRFAPDSNRLGPAAFGLGLSIALVGSAGACSADKAPDLQRTVSPACTPNVRDIGSLTLSPAAQKGLLDGRVAPDVSALNNKGKTVPDGIFLTRNERAVNADGTINPGSSPSFHDMQVMSGVLKLMLHTDASGRLDLAGGDSSVAPGDVFVYTYAVDNC